VFLQIEHFDRIQIEKQTEKALKSLEVNSSQNVVRTNKAVNLSKNTLDDVKNILGKNK
jgi:hypothetical protein